MSDFDYAAALHEIGARHPRVVCLDAGLATSTHTQVFASAFPERYFNLGIAEQNAVGVASGLARRGFVPVLHSFSNFLARRALDQIAISVACAQANVKLVATSAGIHDGRNGPSHTAFEDLATMASLPAMRVIEAGDGRQTRAHLEAIVRSSGPAYLRVQRYRLPDVLVPELGDAAMTMILAAPQAVCTLVLCGSMLATGLQAVQMLVDRGVRLEVVHCSVLQPFDGELVRASALRTRRVITVENGPEAGGFGDAVARVIGPLGISHQRLHLRREFPPAGSSAWLLRHNGLDPESIAAAVVAKTTGEP